MQRSPENLWRAATRPADDLKDSQSLAPRVGGIRTALLAHPIGEAGGEPVTTVASIATAKWPVSTPSANPGARDERLAHHRAPEAGRANVMPHRVGWQTRCGPR